MPTVLTPTVTLPSGAAMPVLGQGTWRMGERRRAAREELAALSLGLDLGLTLIDTAEMYGDGASERLVGKAIEARREEVFLVSKVLPHHATRAGTILACEASLRRLGTDHLDLYLLHWRGYIPLAETVAAFQDLLQRGLIRDWGVSNFDVADMAELERVSGGGGVQTDQVLYNLARRGIEWELLPWCRDQGRPIMAYSPVGQGELLEHPALQEVARRVDGTPAQVALAWLLRIDGVAVIPKAGTRRHVIENHAALDLRLAASDLAELERAFPPPRGPEPLAIV
jgi:diketogulonate reductase-like aldo/keto reductase